MSRFYFGAEVFDVPPKPMTDDDPRNPLADPRFADVDPKDLPATESLKDVIERMILIGKRY